MHKRIITAAAAAFALLCAAGAQDILTAEKFFESAQEKYGSVTDYEAKLSVTANKTPMTGTVIYKAPSLLRIDFTQPQEQVICFNKNVLTVYVPEYRAVLNQEVTGAGSGGAAGANLASKQGLTLLKRYYSIAYETGPSAVPLKEGSTEQVVRLSLSRKTVSEGFRNIKLSISPETKLIRQIEGTTLSGDVITFDFADIKLNQGIADSKFIYDLPPQANLYNDFLFKSKE